MHKTIEMLKRHEGLSLRPYEDSVGKLTIGYGRNLEDVGITKEEAEVLLQNDVRKVLSDLDNISWFRTLDDVRRSVIINMVFNLGMARFLQFQNMIRALKEEDYDRAAEEMKDSIWFKQVGYRAVELIKMMRTGEYP